MKAVTVYILLFILVFDTSSIGKVKADPAKSSVKSHTQKAISSNAPNRITRSIIQDRKGNIWIAAFDGIFRYDGRSFTNITSKISSARFFSVLEDKKGNFWFGSIGSGAYYYDGSSFKHLTTKNGLAGNDVTTIYEDRSGNAWFATNGGASRYDGRSFRNFTTKDGLPNNDIYSIVQDKMGNFLFGTWSNVSIYNGKTFNDLTHDGRSFKNVRSMMKDNKGNIWLGGNDGLWRYNGSTFTNFSRNIVGYVYEDRKGNIWTSSINTSVPDLSLSPFDGKSLSASVSPNNQMVLSRYDGRYLSNMTPNITEIKPELGMLCGILEANDGSIWFCASDGVYRYNGHTITNFKNANTNQ